MPAPFQHVVVAAQPWSNSPAQQDTGARGSLKEQSAALRPISPSSLSTGTQGAAVELVAPPVISTASATAPAAKSAKAGTPERLYSESEYRSMLDLVVSGARSARAAAIERGFPSAERTLQRHAKAIRAMPSLQRDTPEATLLAQLAHVANASLDIKGNPDLRSRRIFSTDELDYFARALKLYSDMGWPMDIQAIQLMFSQAAKEKGRVDWRLGDAYVVSSAYVSDFVKSRPELRAYKAGHIDPLRSKKATAQVSAVSERADLRLCHGCQMRANMCTFQKSLSKSVFTCSFCSDYHILY